MENPQKKGRQGLGPLPSLTNLCVLTNAEPHEREVLSTRPDRVDPLP